MASEDERANGVQPGPTRDPQSWQVGMYQIQGFKARTPVETQSPEMLKPGTLEAVIVENLEGANWWGIVVESKGIRYSIQLGGNSGGVQSQTGDVESVGNRVRVSYRTKRMKTDGSYFLDATRVVQIRDKR